MGKIDELRRQREEQHGRREMGGATAPVAVVEPEAAVAVSVADTRTADGDTGKCSECGKVRALMNGLVANHQKGLGKMCAGSRKEPA